MRVFSVAACVSFVSIASIVAADEGFTPLFNGRNLDGWVNINCAPSTFTVRDGVIISTGKPSGFMRTQRMYENYILELEWRHMSEGGNAGVMVHADALPQVGAAYPKSVEIQVLDGDHGSIFGIQGCIIKPLTLPLKRGWLRARPVEEWANPTGEWNHYRLISQDGNLSLAVNGRIVTRAADASQVKGYICLESEGAEAHFRNIRIRELPSSNPPVKKIAMADEGFVSMFNGLSYDGWVWEDHLKGHWVIARGSFRLPPDAPRRERGQRYDLWTKKTYRNVVMIADWRLLNRPVVQPMNDFTPDGLIKKDEQGRVVKHEIAHAGDSGIYFRGTSRAQVNIWSQPMGSGDINPYHKDASLPIEIRRATVPSVNADKPPREWNRFIITTIDDRISVVLNGQKVIDNALLPDVPESGPIALQHHGDAIEFRSLFIKELP